MLLLKLGVRQGCPVWGTNDGLRLNILNGKSKSKANKIYLNREENNSFLFADNILSIENPKT